MFGRKDVRSAAMAEDSGETVIGSTSNFKGFLKSDNTIRIYGIVDGEVETAGALIIGKTARVLANLSAHEVRVAGAVKGNVTAQSSIEILAGGQVYGDVVSPSLMIEAGAVFSGQSIVKGKDGEPLMLQAPLEEAQS